MSILTDMVKMYAVKYDRKIKAICAPLKDCFGISLFGQFTIGPDGQFVDLCNRPETRDSYYREKIYMQDPFVSHPQLLRSGQVLIPDFYNPIFFQSWFQNFGIKNFFIILNCSQNIAECSYFSIYGSDKADATVFFNQLDPLLKFICYFKRESKAFIKCMEAKKINIEQIKGEAFFETGIGSPLSNKDPNIQNFLKSIMPLSYRERQCYELFRKGHSAQATAAILHLSVRTVESYFDNIKNKMGCSSKAKLRMVE